jgi:hypothetical protein
VPSRSVFRCDKSFVSLEQPQLCISKTTQRMRMEFWCGRLHTKAEDQSVCLHTNTSTRWGFYISQAFWGFLLWIASGSSPNHPKVTGITRCPHFVCPRPSTRIRLWYDGIITSGGGTGELHAEVMYICVLGRAGESFQIPHFCSLGDGVCRWSCNDLPTLGACKYPQQSSSEQ